LYDKYPLWKTSSPPSRFGVKSLTFGATPTGGNFRILREHQPAIVPTGLTEGIKRQLSKAIGLVQAAAKQSLEDTFTGHYQNPPPDSPVLPSLMFMRQKSGSLPQRLGQVFLDEASEPHNPRMIEALRKQMKTILPTSSNS
jgi:hypothetical protein